MTEKRSKKTNIMSHWIYLSTFCFAAISTEEISACLGLSLGITASKQTLDLGAAVTHSDCKKKGFRETGTAAGQGSVEAPWVTCFGHLGMEIRAGSHKVWGRQLWSPPRRGRTTETLGPSPQEYWSLLKEQELMEQYRVRNRGSGVDGRLQSSAVTDCACTATKKSQNWL